MIKIKGVMITFRNLPLIGSRIGNQLFRYAALLSLANQNRCEIGIAMERGVNIHTTELLKAFNISIMDCYKLSPNKTQYTEKNIKFDESFFNIKDNTNINGFFQSEKYFKSIESDLYNNLRFKHDIIEKAKSIYLPYTTDKTVCVSVRRGDYLIHTDVYNILNASYYLSVINLHFDNSYKFLIFSDDIAWCKIYFPIWFPQFKDNIVFINNVSPMVDLCLMSMCDNFVIANSTFSWWGAWLKKSIDKKIIAPKTWFIKEEMNGDIIPDKWIIM